MPHKVNIRDLEDILEAILVADGCRDDEAQIVAEHLVEANLCGHDSHGVVRIGRYHEWLNNGKLVANSRLTPLMQTDTFAHFDGNCGMGQWLAKETTSLGIQMAKTKGSGIVAMKRAGHVGRVGRYAEQACREGIISIHIVNVAGSRLVAPFGSSQRALSTAPIAIGVPNTEGDDFILDFATSLVAEGKALVSARGGAPLPNDALITEDGHLSGNPEVLYGESLNSKVPNPRVGSGALRTMGEHKGSGLAMACELIAGALTGAGANGPTDHTFGNGMLSIFINPEYFGDQQGFIAEVAQYIDYVQQSTPAQGIDKVLIPGDKERMLSSKYRQNGITLPNGVVEDILSIASALNIDTNYFSESMNLV